MQLSFGSEVSDVSFFRGDENSKINRLSIDSNLRAKFLPMSKSTKKSRAVFSRSMSVLHIYQRRGFTQVGKAIVVTDPIDVIELLPRPRTGHPCPCKAMCQVMATGNSDVVISVVDLSGDFPYPVSPARADTPLEDPGFGIVCEQFANAVNGYNVFSHDATAFADWSEPASRHKRMSARLF